MDILNQIICGLNKEQVRFFKMYLSRIETEDERKDVVLFDYIRKSGDNYDDEKIFRRLYDDNEKNSFYRLKNRLMREVNKSLTLQHFDDEPVVYIFRLLALVKFYLNKNALKPAHYFLRKAEQKAKSIENLELLDIIYGEFIKLAREQVSINPEEYILKRKENLMNLSRMRTMDDILAAVIYRLKVTQNLGTTDSSVIQLLQKTIDDFDDKSLSSSPLFRFKMYQGVSQVLLQSHQYALLENYLLKTYHSFRDEKLFNKNNHETKLQMLIYLVNSLYKNGKQKLSLEYADELHTAMKEFGNMLYDKYLFYYYNTLVINYSRTNKRKELDVLTEMDKNPKINSNPFHRQFILLNMSLAWFDLKEFNKAARYLSRLQLLPEFKEADSALRLRIAVTELMIRYELNDIDTFKYKHKQFRKDYAKELTYPTNESEKLMAEILNLMTEENPKKNKSLLSKVKNISSATHADDDAQGLIHYASWLKEKFPAVLV